MNADLEYRASFPGVQSSGNATSLAFIDGRVHSRNIPRPENRWGGLNWGGYVDSEVDQLVEKLLVTIDRGEARQVEGEILSRVSRDVVYFPYFLRTSVGAAAKGFSGVKVIGEACQSGDCEVSWNIAEWDIVR
jgi:ABC-type transport system substrate-binding protein